MTRDPSLLTLEAYHALQRRRRQYPEAFGRPASPETRYFHAAVPGSLWHTLDRGRDEGTVVGVVEVYETPW